MPGTGLSVPLGYLRLLVMNPAVRRKASGASRQEAQRPARINGLRRLVADLPQVLIEAFAPDPCGDRPTASPPGSAPHATNDTTLDTGIVSVGVDDPPLLDRINGRKITLPARYNTAWICTVLEDIGQPWRAVQSCSVVAEVEVISDSTLPIKNHDDKGASRHFRQRSRYPIPFPVFIGQTISSEMKRGTAAIPQSTHS